MSVSRTCTCSSCPAHKSKGGKYAALGRRYFYPSSSLTDAQWALLAPLFSTLGMVDALRSGTAG